VALAALPPLNGFTSKWLLYMSLVREGFAATGGFSLTVLLAIGFLALIGGLAAITFLRLIGIALLGPPRSGDSCHAHESGRWMLGPMAVLIGTCVGVAIAPQIVVGRLFAVVEPILGWEAGRAVREWENADAPLAAVGYVNAGLL